MDEVLANLDALPGGVQAEIRAALRAYTDVVGPAAVRMLEIAAAHDLLEELLADPDVKAMLTLCGLEPEASTPVALSPRPGCELCGEPIGSEHAHGADVVDRRLLCLCRGCALTLHGEGRYRSLPTSIEQLADQEVPPAWWDEMNIPVEVAFFLRGSTEDAADVTAFYPGAAGVVESTLDHSELPVDVAADVEALLVRHRERFEAWRVPVDRCYELAAIVRNRPAGTPPEQAMAPFFERLRTAG